MQGHDFASVLLGKAASNKSSDSAPKNEELLKHDCPQSRSVQQNGLQQTQWNGIEQDIPAGRQEQPISSLGFTGFANPRNAHRASPHDAATAASSAAPQHPGRQIRHRDIASDHEMLPAFLPPDQHHSQMLLQHIVGTQAWQLQVIALQAEQRRLEFQSKYLQMLELQRLYGNNMQVVASTRGFGWDGTEAFARDQTSSASERHAGDVGNHFNANGDQMACTLAHTTMEDQSTRNSLHQISGSPFPNAENPRSILPKHEFYSSVLATSKIGSSSLNNLATGSQSSPQPEGFRVGHPRGFRRAASLRREREIEECSVSAEAHFRRARDRDLATLPSSQDPLLRLADQGGAVSCNGLVTNGMNQLLPLRVSSDSPLPEQSTRSSSKDCTSTSGSESMAVAPISQATSAASMSAASMLQSTPRRLQPKALDGAAKCGQMLSPKVKQMKDAEQQRSDHKKTTMVQCRSGQCTFTFCQHCLGQHINEDYEDAMARSELGAWICPCCRSICCCCSADLCKANHPHCKAYRKRMQFVGLPLEPYVPAK